MRFGHSNGRCLSIVFLIVGGFGHALSTPRHVETMVRRELQSHFSWTFGANQKMELSAVPELPDIEKIEVIGEQWDLWQQAGRFRLACLPRSTCSPFSVLVRMSRAQFDSSITYRPGKFIRARERKERLVIAGQEITLMALIGQLRLTRRVVCLDSGTKGDGVRMRDDHGMILRGRVVSRGLVQAGGDN